ncbi:MAG: hypothetical protein IPP67_00290 [Rhodospirillaceae bacterium]|nr:hypothetical protein [Rhodospirillaceae bacterium]
MSEVKLRVIPAVISPYVIKAIEERQAGRMLQRRKRLMPEQHNKLA